MDGAGGVRMGAVGRTGPGGGHRTRCGEEGEEEETLVRQGHQGRLHGAGRL